MRTTEEGITLDMTEMTETEMTETEMTKTEMTEVTSDKDLNLETDLKVLNPTETEVMT